MTREEKIQVLWERCCERREAEGPGCDICPMRLITTNDPRGASQCLAFHRRTDYELDCAVAASEKIMACKKTAASEPTPRQMILEAAGRAVGGQRATDYGKPEDNFGAIARLWSAYKGVDFTALDVAMMMALLKIARIRSGTATEDSFVDLAGYAACAAECAQREKEGE